MSDLNLTLRIRANADGTLSVLNGVGNSINNLDRNAQAASGTVDRMTESLRHMAHMSVAAFGASWAADKLKDLVSLADSMTLLDSKIKIATSTIHDYQVATAALTQISLETGTALSGNITMFGRLNKSVESMGGSINNTLGLTKTLAEGLKISGASAGEASSTMIQLSQALASGVLRGDEFNSIMENGSRIADALSMALGKSKGELRKMAEEGQLSAGVVVNALQSQAAAIHKDFGQIPLTVGSAMENLNTQFSKFIQGQNEAAGATKILADGVNTVAMNINQSIGAIKVVGEAIVSAYVIKALPSLLAYVQGQYTAIAVNRAHSAAIIENLERTVAATGARVAQTQADIAAAQAAYANATATLRGVAATDARAAATIALTNATLANTAATASAAEAQTALSVATAGAAVGLRALLNPLNLVNAGFALFIGWEFGSWLNGFETVRGIAVESMGAILRSLNDVNYLWLRTKALFSGDNKQFYQLKIDRKTEEDAINANINSMYGTYVKQGDTKQQDDYLAQVKELANKSLAVTGALAASELKVKKSALDEALKTVQSTADREISIVGAQINQLSNLYQTGQVSVKDYFEGNAALIQQQADLELNSVREQIKLINGEIASITKASPAIDININKEKITDEFTTAINAASKKWNIDADLLRATTLVESHFNRFAKSAAGALGPAQLMEATANRFGVTDRTDIKQSMDAMAHYYADLQKMFSNNMQLMIAAYNAGEGTVKKAGNKVPAIEETINHVQRVQAALQQFKGDVNKDLIASQERVVDLKQKSIELGFKESEITLKQSVALDDNKTKLVQLVQEYDKKSKTAQQAATDELNLLTQTKEAAQQLGLAFSDDTYNKNAAAILDKMRESAVQAITPLEKLTEAYQKASDLFAKGDISQAGYGQLLNDATTSYHSSIDPKASDSANESLKKYNELVGKTKESTQDLIATNSALFDSALKGFSGLTGAISNMANELQRSAEKQFDLVNAVNNTGPTSGPIRDAEKYGKQLKAQEQYVKDLTAEENKRARAEITGLRQTAAAAGQMFGEKTAARKAFNVIETTLSALEVAQAVQNSFKVIAASTAEGTAKAGVAVANQGGGDPYTAFARIAAMIALMGSIGYAVGGSGGSSNIAADRQASAGTGTVFGDPSAKSESINKAIEQLKDNSDLAMPISQGMLDALLSIRDNIINLGSVIAKQFSIKSPLFAVDKTGYTGAIPVPDIMGGNSEMLSQALIGPIGIKKSIVDYGITFNHTVNQTLADILNGQTLDMSFYNDIESKIKVLFLSFKMGVKREFEPVTDEIKTSFTRVFLDAISLGKTMADVFDVSTNQVDNVLNNFVIKIADVSLKDLSAEKISEQLNTIFSAMTDEFAKQMLEGTGTDLFQKAGEGFLQTAVRVANGIDQADTLLMKFGVSIINYRDILNKQGDVAVEIYRQSVLKMETASSGMVSGIGNIIDAFDGSIKDLDVLYTKLVEIRTLMGYSKIPSADISTYTIQGAGSIDALQKGVELLSTEGVSKTAQFNNQLVTMQERFANIGQVMPTSMASLRGMVSGIDTTTTAGQRLQGQLIALVPSMVDLNELYQSSINETDALSKQLELLLSTTADTNLVGQKFTATVNYLAEAFGTADKAANSFSAAMKLVYSDQEIKDKTIAGAQSSFDEIAKKYGLEGLKIDDYLSGLKYVMDNLKEFNDKGQTTVDFNGQNLSIAGIIAAEKYATALKAAQNMQVASPIKTPATSTSEPSAIISPAQDFTKQLADFLKPFKDSAAMQGMSDYRKELYNLQSTYDENIAKAKELGATTADLSLITADYTDKQKAVLEKERVRIDQIRKDFNALGQNSEIASIGSYIKEQQQLLIDVYSSGAISFAEAVDGNAQVIAVATNRLINVFKDVNTEYAKIGLTSSQKSLYDIKEWLKGLNDAAQQAVGLSSVTGERVTQDIADAQKSRNSAVALERTKALFQATLDEFSTIGLTDAEKAVRAANIQFADMANLINGSLEAGLISTTDAAYALGAAMTVFQDKVKSLTNEIDKANKATIDSAGKYQQQIDLKAILDKFAANQVTITTTQKAVNNTNSGYAYNPATGESVSAENIGKLQALWRDVDAIKQAGQDWLGQFSSVMDVSQVSGMLSSATQSSDLAGIAEVIYQAAQSNQAIADLVNANMSSLGAFSDQLSGAFDKYWDLYSKAVIKGPAPVATGVTTTTTQTQVDNRNNQAMWIEIYKWFQPITDEFMALGMSEQQKAIKSLSDFGKGWWLALDDAIAASGNDPAVAELGAQAKDRLSKVVYARLDAIFKPLNDDFAALGQTDYQKSVNGVKDYVKQWADAINTAETEAMAVAATDIDKNNIAANTAQQRQNLAAVEVAKMAESQKMLTDFMQPFKDSAATRGMGDYQKELYSLEQTYNKNVEAAKKLGISETDLAFITMQYSLDLEDAAKKHAQAISDFMQPFNDASATRGMSDLGKELYNLQQTFGKNIEAAQKLGVSEAELAIIRGNYAADQQAAKDKARQPLETKLYELTHTEVEAVARARKLELAALDESLRPMQEMINTLTDLKSNVDKAGQALKRAVDAEIQALKDRVDAAQVVLTQSTDLLNRSFDAEKQKLTDSYNAQVESMTASTDKLKSSVSDYNSVIDSLARTVESIQGAPNFAQQQYQQAKASLNEMLIQANGGNFTGLKDKAGTLSALGGDISKYFITAVDMRRDQQLNINALESIKGLTGTQLSSSELLVTNSEAQLKALKSNNDAQIKALDDLRNQTLGVDTSVVSVEKAISTYNDAKMKFDEADAAYKNNKLQELYETTLGIHEATLSVAEALQQYAEATQALADKKYEVAVNVSVMAPNSTPVVTPDASTAGLTLSAGGPRIPGFAAGGDHMGGVRWVGENGPELEFTGPSRIMNNSDSKRLLSNDELIAEMKELRKEFQQAQAENRQLQIQLVKTNKKMADLAEKADVIGTPPVRA